jgi:hypothetical protein
MNKQKEKNHEQVNRYITNQERNNDTNYSSENMINKKKTLFTMNKVSSLLPTAALRLQGAMHLSSLRNLGAGVFPFINKSIFARSAEEKKIVGTVASNTCHIYLRPRKGETVEGQRLEKAKPRRSDIYITPCKAQPQRGESANCRGGVCLSLTKSIVVGAKKKSPFTGNIKTAFGRANPAPTLRTFHFQFSISNFQFLKFLRVFVPLLFIASLNLNAQTPTCDTYFNDSITITKNVTPSICQSDGSIEIILSGNTGPLVNFDYGLTTHGDPSGYSIFFSTNNKFNYVPPGVYDITVRAFCSNDGQWSSERKMEIVTVEGNYQVIDAMLNLDSTRKPYVNCNTGNIVLTVNGGNQDQFVFEIISAPTGVALDTVNTTLAIDYRGMRYYTLEGGDYPEGSYEIEISDGCAKRRVLFTLASISGLPTIPYDGYLYPNNGGYTYGFFFPVPPYNTCNTLGWALNSFFGDNNSIYENPDYYRYFLDGMYEVSLSMGNNVPDIWITWDSIVEYLTISNGGEYRDGYVDDWNDTYEPDSMKLRANIRLKACPGISQSNPSYFIGNLPIRIDRECLDYNMVIAPSVLFPNNTYNDDIYYDRYRLVCYPLSIEIRDYDADTLVFFANNIYHSSDITLSGFPYSGQYPDYHTYSWEIKDAYGTKLNPMIHYSDEGYSGYNTNIVVPKPDAIYTISLSAPQLEFYYDILGRCNGYQQRFRIPSGCFPQDISIIEKNTGQIIYQETADTVIIFPPEHIILRYDTLYQILGMYGSDTLYFEEFYIKDTMTYYATSPSVPNQHQMWNGWSWGHNHYCGEGHGYLAMMRAGERYRNIITNSYGSYGSWTEERIISLPPSMRIRVIDPSPNSGYTGKEYYPQKPPSNVYNNYYHYNSYFNTFEHGIMERIQHEYWYEEVDPVMPAGTYYIEMWDTCSTDSPDTLVVEFGGGFDASAFTYTSVLDTCAGLRIYPSGLLKYGGRDTSTAYRIMSGPDGYDKSTLYATDPNAFFTLVAGGTYKIGIIYEDRNYYNSCAIKEIEIEYEGYDPFRLDPSKTTAYLCVGEAVGHISLIAQYGKKPYTFSLWDGSGATQLINDTTTMDSAVYFHYGSGNATYMVKMQDACNNSFTQNINIIDLQTAKIVYAPNSGKVCIGSPLKLNCITLGVTSYSWEGPNGWTSQTQNPEIPDAQLNMTGWYKVSVRPEFCGQYKEDSVYITVYPIPNKPTVNNVSLRYCQNAPYVSSLTDATGATPPSENETLRWYGPDGVTAISPYVYSYYTAGLFTYYVVSVDNITGCESERESVSIKVDTAAPYPILSNIPSSVLCPNTPFSIAVEPKSPHVHFKVYDEWQNTLLLTTAPNIDTIHLYTPATSIYYTVTAVVDSISCESGRNGFYVNVNPASKVYDIMGVNDTILCSLGSSVTFTPTTGVSNPVFRWYASQTATTPFHIGASYTASNLTSDTILYIGVSGDGYCENAIGDRKEVNVSVYSLATAADVTVQDTSVCSGTTVELHPNTSISNSVFNWYASQTATTPFYTGASHTIVNLTSDTTFYIGVSGDRYCENVTGTRKEVKITVHTIPLLSSVDKELCVGGLTTKLSPSTGGIWRSSNPFIASVSGDTVTAISAGDVYLVYTLSSLPCSDSIKITVYDYPMPAEITGQKSVCLGATITLSNATTGGVWTTATYEPKVTLDNPNANPVTVTGITEGETFVTYAVSAGVCQTKKTFRLKVLPNVVPEIKIGIERK